MSRFYRIVGAFVFSLILISAVGVAVAEQNNGGHPGGTSTREACSKRCDLKYVIHGDQTRPDERRRYASCLAHCKTTYPQ
jgi:hypothetical protein